MWGRAVDVGHLWGSPPTHGCHVVQAPQSGPQRLVLLRAEA